jgi:CxxC-x17-CxxC domain-containing protein
LTALRMSRHHGVHGSRGGYFFPMTMTDRTLTCKDCGNSFVFTAREQEFYSTKGFENDPARCPDCRELRKRERRGPREMHQVVCAACGVTTEVPFLPTGQKPVYCRDCFNSRQ